MQGRSDDALAVCASVGAIAFVAALAVVGEVMIASGMRQLGDLDDIRAARVGRNDWQRC
jgi:hypothetical protein